MIMHLRPACLALALAVTAADLQEHRRPVGAGVEQEARKEHAVLGGNVHRDMSVLGDQGWNAQPEHDGVWPRDLDGVVELVDAGGEDEVLAAAQRLVDRAG